MTLEAGDQAPDFSLAASGGRSVSLAAMQGKPFVLYFYPKADTPGCTREACAFQEALPEIAKLGLEVIGVSRDPMPSVDAFAKKYGLHFPLASDSSGEATRAYGTWIEKSMYGRQYMGIERATFLIDRAGRIAHVWHKVKVNGHAAEVAREAARL
ncbi:MAG: peroxiredoxin [Acetobacteraceae bacterium]